LAPFPSVRPQNNAKLVPSIEHTSAAIINPLAAFFLVACDSPIELNNSHYSKYKCCHKSTWYNTKGDCKNSQDKPGYAESLAGISFLFSHYFLFKIKNILLIIVCKYFKDLDSCNCNRCSRPKNGNYTCFV